MTTTSSRAQRRPWLVMAAVATLVAVFGVASWAVPPPATQTVYRAAAAAATDAPAWVQQALGVVADSGILALAALVLLLTWRARSSGATSLARALVAAGGVVVAYATSELLKLSLTQARPCATLAVSILAECPGPGDWSLPSNHATIAAALATAIALIAPRWSAPAVGIAFLVAAARVGTGVHYPHDVLTGVALGATVVALAAMALDRPGQALLRAATRRWPMIARHP
jgi:undecaprenyl-diphosphatase